MTPFLHRIYKVAQNVWDPTAQPYKEQLLQTLQTALSFECTDVMELAGETMMALLSTRHYDEKHEPLMNHGGLLLLPHEVTWLEWSSADGRIGVVVCQEPDGHYSCAALTEKYPGEYMSCEIRPLPDDDCKIVVYVGDNSNSKRIADMAGMIGQMAVAFLVIINAPYGIEHEVKPPHKVWAKEAAREGFIMKPSRRIYLNKTKAPPKEAMVGDDGAPTGPKFHKAFHFVRRHLRHFKGGGHTLVKAHWRGDPRLGIRVMPEYKVKP
jgi:hypothetical protein